MKGNEKEKNVNKKSYFEWTGHPFKNNFSLTFFVLLYNYYTL